MELNYQLAFTAGAILDTREGEKNAAAARVVRFPTFPLFVLPQLSVP